jgi:hypothetical protein
MKKKGDYTLYLQDEDSGRKITEIEYKQEISGGSYKTYSIKYKSFWYPDGFKYYGMVLYFILKNNETGKSIKYEIGKRPREI